MLRTLLGSTPNRAAVFVTLLLLFLAGTSSGQPLDRGGPESASISGTVLDPAGVPVAGAQVTVIHGTLVLASSSGGEGQFSFGQLSPGSYVVVVQAAGLETFMTGVLTLAAQQALTLPPIRLSVAGLAASVVVRPTEVIAEQQIKAEEQQRLLGVIPNFYVSYLPNAAPMTSGQKLSLAVHETFDWTAFARVAASAGIQQAVKAYSGYGSGAAGFAKRYAASFANERASDVLTHYVFASLFHQDPRYFYQGTGTTRSRLAHALSSPFVARSDSGHQMPNYASLFGNIGGAALSNLYYAESDRGAGLVLTNVAVGIAGRAAYAVMQEFIGRRLTRNAPGSPPSGRR